MKNTTKTVYCRLKIRNITCCCCSFFVCVYSKDMLPALPSSPRTNLITFLSSSFCFAEKDSPQSAHCMSCSKSENQEGSIITLPHLGHLRKTTSKKACFIPSLLLFFERFYHNSGGHRHLMRSNF